MAACVLCGAEPALEVAPSPRFVAVRQPDGTTALRAVPRIPLCARCLADDGLGDVGQCQECLSYGPDGTACHGAPRRALGLV